MNKFVNNKYILFAENETSGTKEMHGSECYHFIHAQVYEVLKGLQYSICE